MLYICSNEEKTNTQWMEDLQNDFETSYLNQVVLLKKLPTLKPNDLVLIDCDQFEKIEDAVVLHDKIPKNIYTIMYLTSPKLAHGTYAIKKGFKSYLGKKTNYILVKQAINTVLEGNVWLYPELMNYIIKQLNGGTQEHPKEKESSEALKLLTSKEVEVAKLVAKGFSNQEIANSLDIQLVTVKKHLGNIFVKLDVKDRVALAILVNK
ncbi:MAG: response regulator transcription factor [Campylobacterales bacterium]|nr:response regulator transcription factor [Campylobacterales bacterium]